MYSTRRQLLSALLAFTLSGCGYQLRGLHTEKTVVLPMRIYIQAQGTDADMLLQTRRVLAAFGAQLVERPEHSDYVVNLGATTQQTTISAIGSYGETSAYMFIMTQPIRIQSPQQSTPLIDTVIKRSREVDASLATQVGGLGAERPLAIYRDSVEVTHDIRDRIIDAVVRILQGLVPLAPQSA